jgi:flagellar biosynthesis chaperone FliJ
VTEKYPLEQLRAIKQRRLDEAEKVLKEKKRLLEEEQKKLAQLEKKRDEVKDHYTAKLTQLREKLDAGTGTDKIQQMKQYLKIVSENLKAEEVKVEAQQKVVKTAETAVEEARKEWVKKQKDVEKLKLHHTEWRLDMDKIEAQKEERASDEMGINVHTLKRKHGRRG